MLPNKCDGMSAIAFLIPLMCQGISRQHLFALSQSASACIKWAVIIDWREARRSTHPIVGELLLKCTTHFFTSGLQTCSIMTNSISNPAIFKSEFVMVPAGFDCDTIALVTLSGHTNQKTVGVHFKSSPMIIPPMPWLDASLNPIKLGHPATNSRHCISLIVNCCSRVCIPTIAARRSLLLLWRYTCAGWSCKIELHGNISPFPAGNAMKACRIFYITDLNSSKGILAFYLRLNHSYWGSIWRSLSLFSCLSHNIVCVFLSSGRRELPSDAVPTARQIHPPQCLQHHTPVRHPISLSLIRC